jgi:N-acetylglucosaminyldiphosphoundecaprenol N-acetyl-beta-D-mannosaminyltransferase
MNKRVEYVLGYEICTMVVNDCVNDTVDWIANDGKNVNNGYCRWLACMNPHSYVVALSDLMFTKALKKADWLIPDGSGLVLASKILGGRLNERVTGSDIFKGVIEALNRKGGYSVFFMGATEDTLLEIRRRMALQYPRVRVAGTYSPPFKPEYTFEENLTMIKIINESNADVLWVGLTAPKQEKWIYENSEKLNVKFAAAIGAVFDFYTERVKRSHPLFQKCGLEWLPRLIQEPRRLWRRMFVSAPIFLWHVCKARIRKTL